MTCQPVEIQPLLLSSLILLSLTQEATFTTSLLCNYVFVCVCVGGCMGIRTQVMMRVCL